MTNQLLDVTADEALSGEVNSAPDNENKGAETLMDIVVKDSLTHQLQENWSKEQ